MRSPDVTTAAGKEQYQSCFRKRERIERERERPGDDVSTARTAVERFTSVSLEARYTHSTREQQRK